MNFDQPNKYQSEDSDYRAKTNYGANYNKNTTGSASSSRDFWGEEERKSPPENPLRKLPPLNDVAGKVAEAAGGLLAKRTAPTPPGQGPKRRRRKLKRPNFKLIAAKLANLRPKGDRLKAGSRANPRRKRTPVTAAIISGLICSAIVLLTEVGIWGLYCYSRGLPGDTNVTASTFMYCFAVFAGCFWAGAVVKRRSLRPVLVLCGVFMALSLLVSLRLFSLAEFKIKMILLKLLFTVIAALLGFVLSLAPYLINKAIKHGQNQRQRRRPQRPQNSRGIQ